MTSSITSAERFRRSLSFSKDTDRLPMVEWATWWGQTIDEWRSQGFPSSSTHPDEISEYLGLDKLHQFWFSLREEGCPVPSYHGGPVVLDEKVTRK